ncbi:hypothetical protein C9374_002954 [Naegleria lovaniensis]|uniref:Uncharacterized protein n=1 Tax=Naegleria lovaniensis TaxID=51637 RepID=A0AA88GN84_NAELO|nr:uncharacterized protein C9374_002954 [Naegleria lovaniensis]KAG2385805.1 hypothetical protein C9374_002954 [Naegleria lovaniensis]
MKPHFQNPQRKEMMEQQPLRGHLSHAHHLHHGTSKKNTSLVYATGSNIDQMLGVRVNAYLNKRKNAEERMSSKKTPLEQRKSLLLQRSEEDRSESSDEDTESDDEMLYDDDGDDSLYDDHVIFDDDDTNGNGNRFGMGEIIYSFRSCEAADYISEHYLEDGDYIEDIKLCYASTFFITHQKRIFMIGNNFLEIGNDKTLIVPLEVTWNGCHDSNKLREISCGHFHVVLVTEKREILVGGSNTYGQLGLGSQTDHQEHNDHFDDEETYEDNSEDSSDEHRSPKKESPKKVTPTKPANALKTLNFFYLELNGDVVESVVCGSFFTVFLTKLRKVYICGQIGFEDSNILHEPTRITFFDNNRLFVSKIFCGSNDIIFLTNDKKVFGFSLLEPETATQKPSHLTYMECFLDQNPGTQVCCGLGHTLFLTPDHKVFCHGSNCEGELALSSKVENVDVITPNPSIETVLDSNEHVTSMACGSAMSILTTNKGSIIVFGDNSEGQLGIGPKLKTVFTATKVRDHAADIPQKVKVITGYHNTFTLHLP